MDDEHKEQRENRSPFILLKALAPFGTYDLPMPIPSSPFLHYLALPNLLRLITEVKSNLRGVGEGALLSVS